MIEGKVFLCAAQCVTADVQIGDRCRASAGRIQRESARETERIKDTAIRRKCLDVSPVVALIEEEPGFLSTKRVRLESKSRFRKNNRPFKRRSVQQFALGACYFCEGNLPNISTEPKDQLLWL